MFEYLMLGDVRARKYSKTGAHTRSILEKFAFDTTLDINLSKTFSIVNFGPKVVYGLKWLESRRSSSKTIQEGTLEA